MTNLELMQSIKTKWGAEIDAACKTSSVPAAFVAALVANESGGDPNAKRFEPGVLTALWKVLAGKTPAFGNIPYSAIFGYLAAAAVTTPNPPYGANAPLAAALERLDGLATSWGLTQVMGYHVLDNSLRVSALPDPPSLSVPDLCLLYTVRLLAKFAESFELDLTNDFEQMLRCWNGGHPTAATADPQYVPNGLARSVIYQGLA